MTPNEALDLLSTLAIFDRREVNAAVARGWAWALDDVPAYLAVEAARRAQDAGVYVDIQAVKRELNAMRPQLESDVRSARQRGLVPADYPKSKPLSPEVRQRLNEARRREFEENNDRPEELSPPGPGVDLGRIGRRIDDQETR